jgi:hypothetical protein
VIESVFIWKELVSSAMKAIKGESVPKVIDTGFYWYDKTNIDGPKIASVLYQSRLTTTRTPTRRRRGRGRTGRCRPT